MIAPDACALARASAARRCVICDAPASVCCPGEDAVWRLVETTKPDGGTTRHQTLISSSTPDIDLCLPHASLRWPWKSERVKRRRA
jgi:hypothetical protein